MENLIYPEKILDLNNLSILINKKIIFTNGCFDILHTGHLSLLKFAKSKGDILIVAINSDSSIKKIKGESRPIVNEIHRLNIILSLKMVDYAILFEEETPYKLIEKIKPNILIKGNDYKNKAICGENLVDEVILAPLVENYSTSNIIKYYNSL